MPDRERQRELFRAAMMELVIEQTYEGTTVEMLLERTGLARRDFDACFADKEACYIETYSFYDEGFQERVFRAFEGDGPWRDRLRAAAYTAARYLRDNPDVAVFGTLEMFRAGPMAQVRREQQLHRLTDMIDAGRQELDDPDSMNRSVAEGVIGAVYGALTKELLEGRGTKSAESFVPELMYLAVRPYLGHEAALEELEIAPPGEGNTVRSGS